jgi:hypothetical protein
MGAYRFERHAGRRTVGLALFAAMCCLALGVPVSAKASSVPVIESESVSNVMPTDATVEARIDTEGLETTYEFYLQEPPPCREANPPCIIEYKPLVLPSGKLLGSFVPQSVSAGLNSAGVTDACLSEDYYWVTATNSAGTTIGRRQQMPAVETLVAVKCTPLGWQLNTTGPAKNAGQGTGTPGGKPPGSSGKTVSHKVLTRGQKLAKALKQCKKEPKRKQAACEKRAHQKYAPVKSKKK